MGPIAVRNPYTGQHDYQFSEPDPAGIAASCARLRAAQPAWAAQGLESRLKILTRFREVLGLYREALVAALITDTGRSGVPQLEVEALLGFISRTCSEAPVALADIPAKPAAIPSVMGSTRRVPLGLVVNISPWNFPVILSFLDTFPALAAGNAVIIKPSEVTPRWAGVLQAALAECPDMAAVLDIVVGTGKAGAALIDHADAVVFTGSVPTGRRVAEAAAKRFIPAFLELGGKDPAIVLPGADLLQAAHTACFCSVQSSGQACQSLERIYVARSLYDRFVAEVVRYAESLPINYPDIHHGVIGPFIMESQAYKVREQIEDAVSQGAILHCGGELIDHGGLWMRPAVLTGVTHAMQLMQEETFGPVVPIMAYDTEDEAVQLANDSQYGLSASVFAATAEAGLAFARRIRAGAISINDASLTALVHDFEHESFGYSGLGRSRSGLSAYTRFTREQSMMVNTSGRPLMLSMIG